MVCAIFSSSYVLLLKIYIILCGELRLLTASCLGAVLFLVTAHTV